MKPLLKLLSDPECAVSYTVEDWDETIRFARHTHLLGHLYFLMERSSLLEKIPARVKNIMLGSSIYNRYFRIQARREMVHLAKQISTSKIPIVLLKGGAYIQAQLGAYSGRRLSDIDLLVAKSNLSTTEKILLSGGWQYGEVNEYDQHYYRDWMHEVPPLIHQSRKMEVDLHHNIVPPVSRIKLDASKLLEKALLIDNSPFYILEAKDLVLHSATHLFFNDELRGGLRDLVDMHELCMQFSKKENFWSELVPRARDLGLQRPLYYALFHLKLLLNTPIPIDVLSESAKDRPNFFTNWLMLHLIQGLIAPKNVENMKAPFAEWLLFVRSHWIRMPLPMLIKHLSYKIRYNTKNHE
ncbi:MAG: nucleotidyltransferase family protein [Bacteroidales bacterium]|nr:nucleotidyltransferase family protein [Bacteroidales bacterium]